MPSPVITPDTRSAELECAREPIHLAGAIQPGGWLVVFDMRTLAIHAVSANIGTLFDAKPDELIGSGADAYFERPLLEACMEACSHSTQTTHAMGQHNIGDQARLCDVTTHARDGMLQIEIEPARADRAPGIVTRTHAAITRTMGMSDTHVFMQQCVAELRTLTGFERAMVYRFLPDDTGVVVAEAIEDGLESWLGQRYPASDIPPQARGLYLLNRIRTIPDTGYEPVPVLQLATEPLDLTMTGLRSISPVHREYLANMGVGAAISMSIVVEGALWGLILCQDRHPHDTGAALRNALDLFGAFFSVRIAAETQVETSAHRRRVRETCMILREKNALDPAGLARELPLLARLVPNAGLGVVAAGEWLAAPREGLDEAARDALVAWLRGQDGRQIVASTRGEWRTSPGALAGVLAVRLGAKADAWLIYFRETYDEEICWAGIPDKHVERLADGRVRIAPRADFTAWRAIQKDQCEAWVAWDLDAVAAVSDLMR